MRLIGYWLLFGLLVSCSAHSATERWFMEATAQDATTGEIKGREIVRSAEGRPLTFKTGPDCVKAALEMGPLPVQGNVAISILCHKVETV